MPNPHQRQGVPQRSRSLAVPLRLPSQLGSAQLPPQPRAQSLVPVHRPAFPHYLPVRGPPVVHPIPVAAVQLSRRQPTVQSPQRRLPTTAHVSPHLVSSKESTRARGRPAGWLFPSRRPLPRQLRGRWRRRRASRNTARNCRAFLIPEYTGPAFTPKVRLMTDTFAPATQRTAPPPGS